MKFNFCCLVFAIFISAIFSSCSNRTDGPDFENKSIAVFRITPDSAQINTGGQIDLKAYLYDNIQPGMHEVSIDGADFPAGEYTYRFISGNYSQTYKMNLVK